MPNNPSAAGGHDDDIVGTMAGEYRLIRKLGEGGFGAVYEARHPVLKRRAAVKVLHQVAGKGSNAVLRFIAEAQAVHQIHSRHIVDVFSFGTLADGRHFYVMDLLSGEPLDRCLDRQKRLDVPTALQLLRPIAEALDAAHDAGIVHRDLKPQNIFLVAEPDGQTVPKLLDFGVAKLLGDSPVHTQSGTPVGTPLYMSPEQARGETVDRRSDVYALGVLCHQLMTGALPISGESTVVVLMGHVLVQPQRASEVFTELSPELDEPILRMLAKDPSLRPATAGAALANLIEAAGRAGHVVPAGLPRLPRPTPRPGEASDEPRDSGRDDDDERRFSRADAEAAAELARLASAGTTGRGRPSPPIDTDAREVTARKSSAGWLVSHPMSPLLAAVILVGGVAVYFLARSGGGRGSVASEATGRPRSGLTRGPAGLLPPAALNSPAPPTPSAPIPPVIGADTNTPPRSVALAVDGAPRGGQVWVDGKSIGDTPGPVPLPFGTTPVRLTITAPGYEPAAITVVPDRPAAASVKMRRRASPGAARTSVPSDLENPF